MVTRLPPGGQDHKVLGLGIAAEDRADDMVDGVVLVHLLHELHTPIERARGQDSRVTLAAPGTASPAQALPCFSLLRQSLGGHLATYTAQPGPQEGRKARPTTGEHIHTGTEANAHRHGNKDMHR